jgi:hypothetical protein
MPSKVTSSKLAVSPPLLLPFLIARAIVSFETEALRGASTATARLAFRLGSGEPFFPRAVPRAEGLLHADAEYGNAHVSERPRDFRRSARCARCSTSASR